MRRLAYFPMSLLHCEYWRQIWCQPESRLLRVYYAFKLHLYVWLILPVKPAANILLERETQIAINMCRYILPVVSTAFLTFFVVCCWRSRWLISSAICVWSPWTKSTITVISERDPQFGEILQIVSKKRFPHERANISSHLSTAKHRILELIDRETVITSRLIMSHGTVWITWRSWLAACKSRKKA